uniref:Protein kinase domain-containing protein n=1 Tax=Thermosporothrix sp. COM3 TaxID=2490863 RepID=A0A455SPG6_9CHLR|nr:hypothetical protein KTC_17450 [Thermosporothrix sp. COM3]
MSFRPEEGIRRLNELLQERYTQIPDEYYILATRLRENRENALKFGDDPESRKERTQIMYALHLFSMEKVGVPFADLCEEAYASQREGKQLSANNQLLGTGKRWAVLVGVGRYQEPKYDALPVCVTDVGKIACQLYENGSGFTEKSIVTLVDAGKRSPTREAILTCVKRVAEQAEENDLLLFYYSGHGDLENDEGYLITSDSVQNRLSETAVPVAQLEDILKASRAKAKLMILDACHAGVKLLSKAAKGLHPKFFKRVFERAQGMAVLASCGQHQRSFVWEEKQCSVYTYFLIEALQGKADREGKGFVTVTDINEHVTNRLAAWSEHNNEVQTPTIQLSGCGDMIVTYYRNEHVPKARSTEAEPATPGEPASSVPASPTSWKECESVLVRGESYVLDPKTVQEQAAPDESAMLRTARALHEKSGNRVILKQAVIFEETKAANSFAEIVRKEWRLAQRLAQFREFPRVVLEEGVLDASRSPTLVYEAWTGPTLRELFERSGGSLTLLETTALVRCMLSICEMLARLHDQLCSHRALTADTIILLHGDTKRPVLRDFGLAAQWPRAGKEVVPIRAPEQRYSALGYALPGLRTDIYQLGVILYTLITGQPFSTSSAAMSVLPASYVPAIQRAVAPLPKDRWRTIGGFAAALRSTLAKR